jgi:hypothetical protein
MSITYSEGANTTIGVEWRIPIDRPSSIERCDAKRLWHVNFDVSHRSSFGLRSTQPRHSDRKRILVSVSKGARRIVSCRKEGKASGTDKTGEVTTLPFTVLNLKGNQSQPGLAVVRVKIKSILTYGFTRSLRTHDRKLNVWIQAIDQEFTGGC